MGIILNITAAVAVGWYNRWRNSMRTRILRPVLNQGSVIICGGRSGHFTDNVNYELTLAEDLKLEAFRTYCERLAQNSCGALVLSAEYQIPSPDLHGIAQNLPDCAFLGKNVSYMPLNTADIGRNGINAAYRFFSRIIDSYCRRTTANKSVILDTVHMLLSLIYDAIGGEFLTFPNIKVLADALTASSQTAFQNYCSRITSRKFPSDWEDFLVLRWDEIRRNFTPFWDDMTRTIERYSVPSARSESLYYMLSSGRICLCGLSSPDDPFRDIILSELALVHDMRVNFSLLDYCVPLPDVQETGCLKNRTCVIIGISLRALNISATDLTVPSCVCLGVKPEDAKDIMQSFVPPGGWVDVRFGLGRHGSHVDFGHIARPPLYEADLTFPRIPDGSAMCLAPDGYEFIQRVTV